MRRAPRLRRLINLWPPYLFSGIRVIALDPEFRSARVALRWFSTEIKTAGGEVVARVRKQLHVRRKPSRPAERQKPQLVAKAS